MSCSIPILEQATVTTSTTQSDSKQPSVNPQTTTPKAPTKSQVVTAKVQAVIHHQLLHSHKKAYCTYTGTMPDYRK